jgi:hypothetical protein
LIGGLGDDVEATDLITDLVGVAFTDLKAIARGKIGLVRGVYVREEAGG